MDHSSVQLGSADTSTRGAAARLKARIVIPVWGAKYIERLAQLCLPALLAPGNLPHLAEHFDCELTIVTESKLFGMVRALPIVREAERHCSLRLVSLDDVLSHPAFYGYTITHALYRGFTDLGEKAKDAWFLFLNADFILADGSYRELVKRMLAGERIIFAPSYCTIEENVFSAMQARRVPGSHAVAIPPREMAGLILDNRHFTVRSKIINWKMYRIDRVDQLYYVLDNDTMLGRQIPIAVVAFRPTRVPAEPVAFWDYGIVSEVCPGCRLSVIGDSDQFLMMELRGERTMSEQFQLGWMDKDEIARDLIVWTTKDQRDCGPFTLVLHRGDLPPNLPDGEKALEEYYRDIMRRVIPEPLDYRDHVYWRDVIRLHMEWVRSPRRKPVLLSASPGGPRRAEKLISFGAFDLLKPVYRTVFGRIPEVGPFHPLWIDLNPLLRRIRLLAQSSSRALSLTSKAGGLVSPRLGDWVPDVDHALFNEILNGDVFAAAQKRAPYDLCFVEVTREELSGFAKMHRQLRSLLRKGGKILVFCRLQGRETPVPRDFQLISDVLPQCDIAELHFHGGWMLQKLQSLWQKHAYRIGKGKFAELWAFAAVNLVIGPLAALANWRASKRPEGELPVHSTSLLLEVTVV